MKIPTPHFGSYFKKSVLHLLKSKIIFFIISVYEILEILLCLVDYQEFFFLLNQNYYDTQTRLSKLLLSILPYSYYFDYFVSKDSHGFNIVDIVVLIYLFLIICFFIYLIFGTKKSNEEIQSNSILNNIIDKVCVNFFDLILFRLAPIYGINAIVCGIFKILKLINYDAVEIIILLLLILFLIFAVILHYFYFSNVCIWNNFKVIDIYFNRYPYEIFYSRKYDIVMFTIKLLVILTINYVDYNNNMVNFLVIFLTLITDIIFIGFVFYTFYLLFSSKNVLYFYLNFYNKLRIFILLFMLEALITRLGLHTNGDYIPYLTFMVMFLILNFYFILSILDSYIITSAISSQNYVGVCWFIQGNDINIRNFIMEWITNHREQCILNDEQCPVCFKICSKLKKCFDIYSEENLLLENDNNINLNKIRNNDNKKQKYNNKLIAKKRNIIKKTTIDELFPPFQFFFDLIKLAEKSKKFMSNDDLIRLDILYITALFYNENNIDYYFYTKLCLLLIKYKKKPQILMTLILIFEIMCKENISSSSKYQILKKNEELRNSLEEYLNVYKDFLLYSDKSPINYFITSRKYKKFKDLLKTIHVYFKKNVEFNYELIVMRYIYETLVHQKFKNIQPFDLNSYADFIEYHYANNKSFTIKNIIDQDIFIILKGSKDILKFQNKHLESLFPSEFQHDAISKFKKELTDFNKKENNHIFEYSINSFINSVSLKFDFVDSFKMRYTIYPTSLINVLYIQVNYIVGYNNIIILEKNAYGFDVLFSFSPKLYKIFGIYPSDINLLKKAGIDIHFNDIFTKSLKNKKNQEQNEKHIYIFEFEKYLELLKHLLTFDILKDSPNYSQIRDNKNHFESMGDTKKEIQFQLTKKWEYNSDNNKFYKFFSIKEIRKKITDKTIGKNTSSVSKNLFGLNMDNEEESNSDEENFEYLKDDSFEGKGMVMAGSTLSSTSLTKSFESAESGKQKGKKDEKLDEKKKKKQQLGRYTYILLCFSIVLIILTIIFLVLETNENNYFRKVINLFSVFRQFKRGIERIPLTLLSNFNILYKNNTSANVYNEYSENLGKKSEILKTYKLNEVLVKEIGEKISSVVEAFNNYQKEINNIGSSLAEKINALTGNAYLVYITDIIFVKAISLNYISLFRQYLNVISTLLQDNTYLKEKFPLVHLVDLNDVDTIVYTPPFNIENAAVLKNLLLLSFSYPFSHSGLVDTAEIILDENKEIIDLITEILIIFFIILFILHVILALVAILFIISFTNILKLNISDSNKLFEDKKFLESHQRRLEQIKIIKNLYSENPLKIAEKIDVIEEFYKRKNIEEVNKVNNKNYTNDDATNILSEKKKEEKPEYGKDNKSEVSKNNIYTQQNVTIFNSKTESFITNNENNNDNNSKKTDLKDMEFNEIKFKNGISSKNIQLTRKQFSSILSIEYILVYIPSGFYLIYSVILFIIVYFKGTVLLKHLVDYSNYNDLLDGYVYDISNALLFMIQTNSTSLYYGYITHPDRVNDYIEEGIDLLHETIIGKDDIELYKEGCFPALKSLINLNCSAEIIKDDDFMKIANNLGFDYNKYFGELCKIFPVAQSGSDGILFNEILYLTDLLYRNFSTHRKYEDMFRNHLNQKKLYDLYTLILTFNRMQRNYFNDYVFSDEVNEVLDYFAVLMYIYLIISVILEIIIFIVVYMGIIEQVKKKDKVIMSFLESLKYE